MRLLIIALDAICPDRVRALSNHLPVMTDLLKTGQLCDVEVVDDPCSTDLWVSFATGIPIHEHAVHGLTQNETGELWRADVLPTGHLPDVILNRQGITAGLFNLPVVTYPVRPLAGWMTSGDLFYPGGVYPIQLSIELETYPEPSCQYDYPSGPISAHMVKSKHDSIFSEFMERGMVSLRNLKRLLEWHEPGVVFAYWHCFDSIQHHLLNDEERIAEAYMLADSFIGELRERFAPEHLLVVSDHGMRLPCEADQGRMIELGGLSLLEMSSGGERWLSCGIHTNKALCIASWRNQAPKRTRAINEVLPWAFDCCGLSWEPVATANERSVISDQMSEPERESVLRRLRELGYE